MLATMRLWALGAVMSLALAPAALAGPPPLHLTEAQRAQIQEAVRYEDTTTTFQLKATKGAKDFEPKIGETIPKGVVGQALPRPLIYSIPELKQYMYVKMKHEILIVNPMTKTIADLFPET
jgi:hypothetical protein